MLARLAVISLDGVSHGLLGDLVARGHMPVMARLCRQCGPVRLMRSTMPPVSATAWASYATGCNPGKHGIFGFVDYDRSDYSLKLLTASSLRQPTLWQLLSDGGKSVLCVNVPCTYPPRPVNGILIGGFLSPDVDRAVYPASLASELRRTGYRIDIDPMRARASKAAMLDELDVVLNGRIETALGLLDRQTWDYFHLHIMGTDRINHFLLRQWCEGSAQFAERFAAYYRRVDEAVGRLLERIGDEAALLMCSDHGFCPIRSEVNLGRYLVDTGWTHPLDRDDGPLSFDAGKTRAFCLTPGRIYVNLRGREAAGCVSAEEYQQVLDELSGDLMALCDPQGRPVLRDVVPRRRLYCPPGRAVPGDDDLKAPHPYCEAPDLLAIPHDGYDLKTDLHAEDVFVRTELEGMHTYADAFLLARRVDLPGGDVEIRQLAAVVLRHFGLPLHPEQDAEPLPSSQ